MDFSGKEPIAYGGTVEEIIYSSEDTGYCVFELATETDELITAVGTIPYIAEGEMLTVYGSWVHHSVYGRQFSVESYEKRMPSDEASMLKYLSSGAVKGIGPKTAARIIERYGTESFDVIENHPDFLAEIPGISAKKAEHISENFRKQSGMRSVMLFCREFFGPAVSVKIFQRWGASAVDVIKKNPYRLCEEIDGIGFERADAVAASLGTDHDSPERAESGVEYILLENGIRNGHTCLPYGKLAAAASEMLGIRRENVTSAIGNMLSSGRLKSLGDDETKDDALVFAERVFCAESYSADKLMLIDSYCRKIDAVDAEILIEKIELEEGIRYAELQRKAIESALAGGIFILTGGPGTGKTTVIRALIRIFSDIDLRVALAAPTGRAAKRMSEATSCEAKTIHRLLEMNYSEGGDESGGKTAFFRNENNLLEEDVLIVDEASMMDIFILESLLKAVKKGARLILIGDADQLPSVGAGNVFSDLIASGVFRTVRLTEIFRQAQASMIVNNAHAVNRGEYPDLTTKRDGDFFFLRRQSEQQTAETVVDLCVNRLPKKYGQDAVGGLQVITPSKKGASGAENLNIMLQAALNPKSRNKLEKQIKERVYRVGDRVMQTKNNYDIEWEKDGKKGTGVFNGDIGIIEDMDYVEEAMTVNFDGRYVIYDFSMCDDLDHAYAVTVHKSQGSEYPIVVIPVCAFAPQLRTRNLLYTAITRAKKMAILVGREDTLFEMVDNNRQAKRYTGLCDMLKKKKTVSG